MDFKEYNEIVSSLNNYLLAIRVILAVVFLTVIAIVYWFTKKIEQARLCEDNIDTRNSPFIVGISVFSFILITTLGMELLSKTIEKEHSLTEDYLLQTSEEFVVQFSKPNIELPIKCKTIKTEISECINIKVYNAELNYSEWLDIDYKSYSSLKEDVPYTITKINTSDMNAYHKENFTEIVSVKE